MATAKKDTVIDALFDVAYELREAKVKLYDRIAANRRSLRDLDTQGLLDTDQSQELHEELYPPKRKGENEESSAEEE